MPSDYARVAWERGLAGIIFTCHCPLPDEISSSVRMAPEDFPVYLDLIAETTAQWSGRLDVRAGIESDYFPGFESWLEKLHSSAQLHHVIGSIHHHMSYYRDRFDHQEILEFRKTYFDLLARSAESGLFDTLAHPDLVKNEEPHNWSFDQLREDIARTLDRIAATGVAMELNTSGRLKSYPEMNPSLAQLRMMRERGIPVVLGADAHTPERVADCYKEALEILISAGYTHVSLFLERKRHDISVHDALLSLNENNRHDSHQPEHYPV